MNILPVELREQIHAMSRDGATTREIAGALGVSVETVRVYDAGFSVWRRELRDLMVDHWDALLKAAPALAESDPALALLSHVLLTCPMHPESKTLDVVEYGVCRLCVRDGLRRHQRAAKPRGAPSCRRGSESARRRPQRRPCRLRGSSRPRRRMSPPSRPSPSLRR